MSPEIGEDRKRRAEEKLESTSSKRAHREDIVRRSPDRRERERDRESRREDSRNRGGAREPSAREVERNPSRFGLDHIPIRGTAGRRRSSEVIPAGHLRPAEPVGPPPPRRDEGRRYEDNHQRHSGNRNPGGGAKRWKGYSHYNRGVNYWKNRKRGR